MKTEILYKSADGEKATVRFTEKGEELTIRVWRAYDYYKVRRIENGKNIGWLSVDKMRNVPEWLNDFAEAARKIAFN